MSTFATIDRSPDQSATPSPSPRTWTPTEQAANRRHVAEGLLGGEFAQGVGRLSQDDRYCWAGVACVVLNRVYPGMLSMSVDLVFGWVAYSGCNFCLPSAAVAALGLRDEWGTFDDHEHDSLTLMSDALVPFPQIAALLLDPPPGLLAT